MEPGAAGEPPGRDEHTGKKGGKKAGKAETRSGSTGPRPRSGSCGPTGAPAPYAKGGKPAWKAGKAGGGKGRKGDAAAPPPPLRLVEEWNCSRPHRLLRWLFSDENYSADYDLLVTAGSNNGFVPVKYIAERLGLPVTDVANAFVDGFQTSLELDATATQIRRKQPLSESANAAAKRLLEAGAPTELNRPADELLQEVDEDADADPGASSKTRIEQVLEKAEYYFSDENLPFDFVSLRQLSEHGSFKLHFMTTAPALQKLKCTDDEVFCALATSDFFELEGTRDDLDGVRVKIRQRPSAAAINIAKRTLANGQRLGGVLSLYQARLLEYEYQSSSGKKGKSKGKGKGYKGKKGKK
ncbi:hypothetical protein DIPPA_26276 [Diplonema papillatum]|nr:hypothetical protein DIPPA_26276 [Diplonema papillatum]